LATEVTSVGALNPHLFHYFALNSILYTLSRFYESRERRNYSVRIASTSAQKTRPTIFGFNKHNYYWVDARKMQDSTVRVATLETIAAKK
jgi:hypothetical protein